MNSRQIILLYIIIHLMKIGAILNLNKFFMGEFVEKLINFVSLITLKKYEKKNLDY